MFASRKYEKYDDDTLLHIDKNLGSILRDDVVQKVNMRMRSDKVIILSLPNNTVNCSLDLTKRVSVVRYIDNLVLLTGIEFIRTLPTPRVEGITDYIKPTKYIGTENDVDVIHGKIDTHSVILKTVSAAANKTLLKDYIISLHLNTLNSIIPNFLTTYAMVSCKSVKDDVFEYNKLCNKYDNPGLSSCVGNIGDTSNCNMRYFSISDGVNHGIGEAATFTLHDFITNNPGTNRADLCALVTQVLIGIHYAQQKYQFQHNELILKNILIHKIPIKKFNYKISGDDADIVFSTDKIAVIHNFTSSKINQNVIPGWIETEWGNLSSVVANNALEKAYWDDNLDEMKKIMEPNFVEYGDDGLAMALGVDDESEITINNLYQLATSQMGVVIRPKPDIVAYNGTTDMIRFIADLFEFADTLTDENAAALVRHLHEEEYGSIQECIADIRAHLVAGEHQEVKFGLHPIIGPVPILLGGNRTGASVLGHVDEETISDKELEHKINKYAHKLSELITKNSKKIHHTLNKKIRQRGGVDIDAVIRGAITELPFTRDLGYGASGLPGDAVFNFDMLELQHTYQENDAEAYIKEGNCIVRETGAPQKMFFGNPGDTVFFSYNGNQIMYDNVTPDKLPKNEATPYTYNFAIVRDKHSNKMKIRFGRIFNGTEIGGRHIHLMRNDNVYITGEIKILWDQHENKWKIIINMNSSKTGYTQKNGFFTVANIDPSQAQKNLYIKWLFNRLRAMFIAMVPEDYVVGFDPSINMEGDFLAAGRNLGGLHEYYTQETNFCPPDDFINSYNKWGRENNVDMACMDYVANGMYAKKAVDWSNSKCSWKLLPQVPQI